MKTRLVKIFLILVLLPIFLFLFTKEVNAGCYFYSSYPWDPCPGESSECITEYCSRGVGEDPGNAMCGVCVGEWKAWYCCDNCGQCSGGGGTPDSVKPQCGVRIEPYIASGNKVINPGFESAGDCSTSLWNTSFETTKKWRRSLPCSIRGSGSFSATQNISVEQGAIYEITLYGRASRDYSCEPDEGWGNATVKIDGGPGGIHGYGVANGKYGDTGWREFKTTYYAHDSILTLELKGHMENASGCWYAFAAFDDISVVKIEGAESSPGENVNLRIGAWDDRNNFPSRRIRNDDLYWPNDDSGWGGFGTAGAANNIPWTLSSTGTVYVQVKDGSGNISNFCSDSIYVPPPTGTITGTVYDITVSGASCPLSGDTVSGGSVRATSTSNTYGPIGANPTYTFSDIVADDQYVVTMTTIPEDYTNPYYCDGSLPGQFGGITVDLSADETEEVNIGLTKLADPWFQTKEGDVHSQGSITVPIPEGEYFCEKGDGGTPGVVSYGGTLGSDPWGEGEVSETGWLANTSFSRKKFNYFYQLLGSPETETWDGNVANFPSDPGTGETEVIYTTSPARLPGFSNLSGRKIVVLVGSNAIIENDITISDGFLAVIASGQINIDDLVSEVHGVYIADGHISTGAGNVAFAGEGMFIANSFTLGGRDLGVLNDTEAAVKFIYRPDLWLNAPAELLVPSYTWQELAP